MVTGCESPDVSSHLPRSRQAVVFAHQLTRLCPLFSEADWRTPHIWNDKPASGRLSPPRDRQALLGEVKPASGRKGPPRATCGPSLGRGVFLWWELEEPKGPEGPKADGRTPHLCRDGQARLGPLGPLGCECAQHRPTPRPSVERIYRKALFSDL